jgi:hypothetical protein
MDIKHIKEIADKYTPEQIEKCISQQIESGGNICHMDESTEKILNELAKAEFIKELQNKGISFTDALRELARRMRLLQGKTK